jgi:Family of unknown function (DUF5681)
MTDDPVNNGRDPASGRFTKGNPGRPLGSRSKYVLAVEAILDGESEALARKAVEMALAGDTVAMRLCLERIAPPRKDRPVSFPLPKIESAAEGPALTASLLDAVAAGEVTPSEAIEVASLVEKHVRVLEAADFDTRLKALEEREGIGNGR